MVFVLILCSQFVQVRLKLPVFQLQSLIHAERNKEAGNSRLDALTKHMLEAKIWPITNLFKMNDVTEPRTAEKSLRAAQSLSNINNQSITHSLSRSTSLCFWSISSRSRLSCLWWTSRWFSICSSSVLYRTHSDISITSITDLTDCWLLLCSQWRHAMFTFISTTSFSWLMCSFSLSITVSSCIWPAHTQKQSLLLFLPVHLWWIFKNTC